MSACFSLADLCDSTQAKPVALPLQFPLNTLRQVRTHIDQAELTELAESIRARGQLEPGLVTALTDKEAEAYLADINELWNMSYSLAEMNPCTIDGVEYYCFVVFGHRRLRACKMAARLQKDDPLPDAAFDGRFRCTLYFGLQLREAVLMQLNENNYHKPSLQDELRGLWQTWRLMVQSDHRLTTASFARKVGVSADKVRQALLFAELPESIQHFADPGNAQGTLPCGFLVELARLARAHERARRPLTEAELWSAVLYLMVRQTKLSAFRAEVSARIAALEQQQDSLFALAETSPSRTNVRRVAEAQSLQAYLGLVAYLRRIIELDKAGMFGEVSPPVSTNVVPEFSPQSPARMAQRVAGLLCELGPRLVGLVAAEGRPVPELAVVLAELPAVQVQLAELMALQEVRPSE